jgi:hypothetical protein
MPRRPVRADSNLPKNSDHFRCSASICQCRNRYHIYQGGQRRLSSRPESTSFKAPWGGQNNSPLGPVRHQAPCHRLVGTRECQPGLDTIENSWRCPRIYNHPSQQVATIRRRSFCRLSHQSHIVLRTRTRDRGKPVPGCTTGGPRFLECYQHYNPQHISD